MEDSVVHVVIVAVSVEGSVVSMASMVNSVVAVNVASSVEATVVNSVVNSVEVTVNSAVATVAGFVVVEVEVR